MSCSNSWRGSQTMLSEWTVALFVQNDIRNCSLFLRPISSPLVEDPYVQGKIAAANVLSDMYALGIFDIDNVLMIVAASRDMDAGARHKCTQMMMRGFADLCKDAGTRVTGGQTVLNPWPIIGGVAKSIAKEADFIRPEGALVGDVVVLTKPIGTQVAVNLKEWMRDEEKFSEVSDIISTDEVNRAYKLAVGSMVRLNRTAAQLMHKYSAHAATDVTGFGLRGHFTNLAENQRARVHMRVHTLPVIRSMTAVADRFSFFRLREGYSAETSGGLLVVLPKKHARKFCDELESKDGWPTWIIADVVST
eukprot:1100340_1